jgi:orotate phosphoribosyltransferase
MNLKEMLIKEGVIKIRRKDEEPFVINEFGTKSRLFIDIKEASLNPDILNEIKRKIYNYNEYTYNYGANVFNYDGYAYDHFFKQYDRIASIAIGGIPIATMLSISLNIPQIIVRSRKHDRGTQSQIIGNCEGKNCILIEDVSVSGQSIINAANVIRNAGGTCDTCLVIIDRQEGAEKNCSDNNIRLLPLLKKSDLEINLDE